MARKAASDTQSLFTGASIWRTDPVLAFESWMREQNEGRGFSASTTKAYRALWARYVRWLAKKRTNAVDVKRDTLWQFLDSLEVIGPDGEEIREVRRQQRERYHRLIERVLNHIHARSLGTRNQASTVATLRGQGWRDSDPNEPTSFLGREVREQLIGYGNAVAIEGQAWVRIYRKKGKARSHEETRRFTTAWRGVRNRAAVALFLGAGLKVAEALNLTVYCINFKDGPWISAKRAVGPPRRAQVYGYAQAWLQDWLAVRHATGVGDDVPLLCAEGGTGEAMTAATLSRVVASFAAAAAPASDTRVTAQILRNEYGAQLVDAGDTPAGIAERMGFAKVISAERLITALDAWRLDNPNS